MGKRVNQHHPRVRNPYHRIKPALRSPVEVSCSRLMLVIFLTDISFPLLQSFLIKLDEDAFASNFNRRNPAWALPRDRRRWHIFLCLFDINRRLKSRESHQGGYFSEPFDQYYLFKVLLVTFRWGNF